MGRMQRFVVSLIALAAAGLGGTAFADTRIFSVKTTAPGIAVEKAFQNGEELALVGHGDGSSLFRIDSSTAPVPCTNHIVFVTNDQQKVDFAADFCVLNWALTLDVKTAATPPLGGARPGHACPRASTGCGRCTTAGSRAGSPAAGCRASRTASGCRAGRGSARAGPGGDGAEADGDHQDRRPDDHRQGGHARPAAGQDQRHGQERGEDRGGGRRPGREVPALSRRRPLQRAQHRAPDQHLRERRQRRGGARLRPATGRRRR